MERSHTEALADFAASISYEQLPATVVHDTKRLILDTIACSVGSHFTDAGKIVVEVGRERGGRPESSILVTGEKTSCGNAAYVNSALANLMDFDDSMVFAGGHLAQVSVLPALAFAEREGASGKDYIAAVAVAFEVATRIGSARLRGNMYFDAAAGRMELNTNAGQTWGCFAAATGAGRLLKFDGERMAHAFGLAGYAAPIPTIGRYAVSKMTNRERGIPMSKYTLYGAVAEAGVMGALLAAKGFTGDRTILDGERGFGKIVGADGFDFDKLFKDLGKSWNISGTSLKPYPTGRDFQSVVTLFEKMMRENDLRAADVERVDCGLFGRMAESAGHAVVVNQIDASMSMNYAIAMIALGYAPGPEWQNPARFQDARVKAFAERVKAYGWDHADQVIKGEQERGVWRGAFPCKVEIRAGGKTYGGEAEYTKGDPWFPDTRLSDDDVATKFRNLSVGLLRTDQIGRAIDACYQLDTLDQADELVSYLT